jgi:hypothetical protein
MKRDYQADLDRAHRDLGELLDQREQLEISIAKKKQQIAALMTLTEQNEEVDQVIGMTLGGLTEAVIAVFRAETPKALTPVQVKEKLAQLGFPVAHYRNVMAAIHTILKRLSDGKRIFPVPTADGENAYRLRLIEAIKTRPERKGGSWK